MADDWEREYVRQLGRNIRRIRKSKGLSQKALGELLGIWPSVLCHWELGERKMGITALQRIADALGVTSTSLLPKD